MMHAIVSVLPELYRNKVIKIWKQLREEFGVKKIMEDPYPHFSWHLAGNYDYKLVRDALEEFTNNQESIIIHTSGLGVFTGLKPVLFIPIVKTERILDLHAAIWKRMNSIAENEYIEINLSNYDPDNWIPHITLAFRDTDAMKIGDMVEFLILEDFQWEFSVDNLAISDKPLGENGRIQKIFNFNG